jgi:hypothetical protein
VVLEVAIDKVEQSDGYKVALQLREPGADNNGADCRPLIIVVTGQGFWMVSVHGDMVPRVLMVRVKVSIRGRGVAVGVGGGDNDRDGGPRVRVDQSRSRSPGVGGGGGQSGEGVRQQQ